jgi:hypothetical protein
VIAYDRPLSLPPSRTDQRSFSAANPDGVQMLSRRESPFVKLHNKDGQEQMVMLEGRSTAK